MKRVFLYKKFNGLIVYVLCVQSKCPDFSQQQSTAVHKEERRSFQHELLIIIGLVKYLPPNISHIALCGSCMNYVFVSDIIYAVAMVDGMILGFDWQLWRVNLPALHSLWHWIVIAAAEDFAIALLPSIIIKEAFLAICRTSEVFRNASNQPTTVQYCNIMTHLD